MDNMPVCHVCGITLTPQSVYKTSNSSCFFECPVCGRYEVGRDKMFSDFDMNHLASYLFYNAYKDEPGKDEKRYHALFRTEKEEGSVFVDKSMVESWYPKTFAERGDKILLYLGNHIRHIGQAISLSVWETYSLLFIDRYENNENKCIAREGKECNNEVQYFLDSLVDDKFIKYSFGTEKERMTFVQLTPEGYSRIDELQKNTGHGRDVFVAMKYGDETKRLRESIRRGMKSFQDRYESRIRDLETQLTASAANVADQVGEGGFDPDEIETYDVFISHATEDKESFVDELVEELRKLDINVWYDTNEIKWGDSIREKIDEGLRKSRFGIAVLSPAYIAEGKYWTKAELDALFQNDSAYEKRLLPIWYNLTYDELMKYSPMLASRKGLESKYLTTAGIAQKVKERLDENEEEKAIDV